MFSPSQEQLASSSSSEFYLFKLYASKADGITHSFMLPLSSHNKVFTLYVPNKHMLILFANPVEKQSIRVKKDSTVITKFQNFEINAFRKAMCLQFTSVPTTFI